VGREKAAGLGWVSGLNWHCVGECVIGRSEKQPQGGGRKKGSSLDGTARHPFGTEIEGRALFERGRGRVLLGDATQFLNQA